MRIVIATPLYPPETAKSALYIKELVKRLAKKNQIKLVIYGHRPEKIPRVAFVCVEKALPLFFRMLGFTIALWKAALKADLIYIENGASVELPAGLIALFTRRPLIIHAGDIIASRKAGKNLLFKYIKRFAALKAQGVIDDCPLPRPEIIPFRPKPQTEFAKYEKSWKKHLKILKNAFLHAAD